MKILLFGGTTEGRTLAQWLLDRTITTTICVATEYGGELLPQGCDGHVGRLTIQEMKTLMAQGYTQVIDATHPYAVNVTENIKTAAQEVDIPLWRLIRDTGCDMGDWHWASDIESAVKLLGTWDGNILLTTGSKDLDQFTDETIKHRCFPRVLPVMSSLERCLSLGFSPSHIICMQGPFSVALNEALMAQFEITTLVTKASGTTGGFFEKVQATKNTGCRLVVVGRPTHETGLTLVDVLDKLEGDICTI